MPFEPEDITGAVAVWVADDLALSDGTAVSAWADRVSSLSLAQATTPTKPTYHTSSVASQPAVTFDGGDLLRYAGTLTTATSGSVFTVVQFNTFSDEAIWSSCDEATTNYTLWLRVLAATQKAQVNQRSNDTADALGGTAVFSTATPYLLEVRSDGATTRLFINDVEDTLSASTGANNGDWFGDTANRDNFVLGAIKRTTEANFLDGRIPVCVVTATPSDADRSSFYGWLNAKYGFDLPYGVPLGQAVETDTATALSFGIGVGQALETDTAGVITPDDAGFDFVAVGQAVETDTATSLGVGIGLGQAVERDTGMPIRRVTPAAPAPPHVASPVWQLEITERGNATVIAFCTQGDLAADAPIIHAECMDPLNDIGVGSIEVPLSSGFAAELVANRLLHLRILDGVTDPIITSCVIGAPTDVVRDADVRRQTRTAPLQSLAAVLNDSVVVPPGGWNVLPRGDDRRYDWSDPTLSAPSGDPPVEVGTVSYVNGVYPVTPYFANSLKPGTTKVISWSSAGSLEADAPAGTIYSREDVSIPAGFYKFRGVGDNWIDTLRVQGTEIMGFQFGFIDGWETQTFEWSGGDPAVIEGKMAIACAWTNQPEEGRGPITLALELINATTNEIVWSTSASFKGIEFPEQPPGSVDGVIARLNLEQSQLMMGALTDVVTSFFGEVDSNGVQWDEVEGIMIVSTKSRTKLAAFHLHERSAYVESRFRYLDSGEDAGKIAWDLYLLGGRGSSKDVPLEVDVDIGAMSIDREEPSATSLAYAARDRYILAQSSPPEGQPVVVGVADYEASWSAEEAARVAQNDLADFNHVKEKIAIEHVTWAADYWTADTLPAVATDGDGNTIGARVLSMHWWIDENGNLRAEPEFGELFVPVAARAANAVHRMAPRGLAGRSGRTTRP